MTRLAAIARAAAWLALDHALRRLAPSIPDDLFDVAWEGDDDPVHDDIDVEVTRELDDLYLATQVARWRAEL